MAPLLVLFTLRQPLTLCLVFVVFSFFRIHEAFPALEVLHIPQLTAAPTIAVLLWRIFGTGAVRPFWTRELTALTVFFVLVTLGVFAATSRPTAWSYWSSTYVKIFAMVLTISWIAHRPKDFSYAAHMIVIAGVLIASVALYNKANGIGLVEGTRVTIARDIKSVLGDPNDLSLVLLFPLSFATSLVVVRERWSSAILGALAVVCIMMAIVATQSRGGLMGAAAVFSVFGSRVIKSKALLIGIGTVAILVLFAAAGISGRASGGAAEAGIDESSMGRIYAWGAAWRMALSRPFTGVGLDNFTSNYFFYSAHWDGLNHAVHSTWFGVLAETGFLGLISFVTMVVMMAWTAFRTSRAAYVNRMPRSVQGMSLALFAGVVGFCVSGTFLTQGFTWPLYILLALCVALSQYANNWLQNAKADRAEASDSCPHSPKANVF
jgi:putative inorganic carbon (HCO3(-)) transporter